MWGKQKDEDWPSNVGINTYADHNEVVNTINNKDEDQSADIGIAHQHLHKPLIDSEQGALLKRKTVCE